MKKRKTAKCGGTYTVLHQGFNSQNGEIKNIRKKAPKKVKYENLGKVYNFWNTYNDLCSLERNVVSFYKLQKIIPENHANSDTFIGKILNTKWSAGSRELSLTPTFINSSWFLIQLIWVRFSWIKGLCWIRKWTPVKTGWIGNILWHSWSRHARLRAALILPSFHHLE